MVVYFLVLAIAILSFVLVHRNGRIAVGIVEVRRSEEPWAFAVANTVLSIGLAVLLTVLFTT